MRAILRVVLVLLALAVPAARGQHAPADPLPSWNGTDAQAAILEFLRAATTDGSPGFIPPAERIAVFDNDGTLWAEQPAYFQLLFAIDRVKAMAPRHPEWKDQEPFASILAGDTKKALAGGEKAALAIVAATHAGMTTDEFADAARAWMENASHPVTGRPYTEMVYAPMLEVLTAFRAAGFKTYIVSGGGADFMRVFAERVYGVPPEQVIGTTGRVKFELREDGPALIKLPEVEMIDDKEGKPAAIHNRIGRRPAAAFGNSDGDLAMLQWTAAGDAQHRARARLAVIIHHTDSGREWAYDRGSSIGTLDRALDEASSRGFIVVDMKQDWKRVFGFEP